MTRTARAALVGLAAAALTTSLAAPAQASQPVRRYVNLGDSYSAGSGVLPLSDYHPACTQTSRNWAHAIAADRGYSLTDVSCGAAQTKDLYTSQLPGVAPQLDAVDRGTDLVTLTLGGNDNNTFIGAIAACSSAAATTAGTGHPCRTLYGDRFATTINNRTYPALVQGLRDIRAKAPRAKVVISGYLRIMPADNSSCYPQMPVASGDVAYLNDIQDTLNRAVRRAARTTGATYVDVSGVSVGRDACKAPGVRWVEPAAFTTQYIPVHPNAAGEQAMAKAAIRQAAL